MEDLHQRLVDARGELPPRAATLDLDLITAHGRKIVRRRRWSAVAAAVAVTLAAGSLIPAVRREHHPSPPGLPASPAQGFAATVQSLDLGDLHVGPPIMVTPGYEVAPVSRDHIQGETRVIGAVEVYRPGVFDPHLFQAGTPVTVAGKDGFRRVDTTVIKYGGGSDQRLATLDHTAVAWPYAPNAWAIVRSSADSPTAGLTPATVQQLASNLTLGPPAPVKLPFRLGYVPPGLSLEAAGRISLGLANDRTLHRLGEATLAPPRPFTALTGPPTLTGITVVEERQPDGVPRGAPTCDDYGCYRGLPGTDLYIGVTGKLPTAELRQVLNGVTTANPSQPATWFPVHS
jgi:hypothetical protein